MAEVKPVLANSAGFRLAKRPKVSSRCRSARFRLLTVIPFANIPSENLALTFNDNISDLGIEASLFKTADKLRGNTEPSD